MNQSIMDIKMKENLVVEAVFFNGIVKDFDVSLLFEKHPEYKILKHDTELWKKAEITALDSKHYDLASIPMNTQIDLTFMLSNIGTEDLRGLAIECTGDEGLKVLNGNGSISFLGDGNDVMLRGLRAVGTESGNHTLTITVTDRDGDTWSSSFDVTVV